VGASRTLTNRERVFHREHGMVLAVMLFSIVTPSSTTISLPNSPEGAFVHLGSRRTQGRLTIAKILGVLALPIPAVPFKVKEFAFRLPCAGVGCDCPFRPRRRTHPQPDLRHRSLVFMPAGGPYYYFDKSHTLETAAAGGQARDKRGGKHEDAPMRGLHACDGGHSAGRSNPLCDRG
jgi:hypothetical protein